MSTLYFDIKRGTFNPPKDIGRYVLGALGQSFLDLGYANPTEGPYPPFAGAGGDKEGFQLNVQYLVINGPSGEIQDYFRIVIASGDGSEEQAQGLIYALINHIGTSWGL